MIHWSDRLEPPPHLMDHLRPWRRRIAHQRGPKVHRVRWHGACVCWQRAARHAHHERGIPVRRVCQPAERPPAFRRRQQAPAHKPNHPHTAVPKGVLASPQGVVRRLRSPRNGRVKCSATDHVAVVSSEASPAHMVEGATVIRSEGHYRVGPETFGLHRLGRCTCHKPNRSLVPPTATRMDGSGGPAPTT